jgi:hypothetical protein
MKSRNKKTIIIVSIITMILLYFGYKNYLIIEERNKEFRNIDKK